MSKIKITEYFNTSVCDYGSYDNYRKVASAIDGLKVSARKCLHIMLKDNIKEPFKVQNFCARVSEKTNYIHGALSLYGVTVGLAQNFVGSNNIPLFKRKGSFGTRLIPEAAADRYIFTCKEDILDKIYMEEDIPNLIEQTFEGDIIEPKFYIPIIPMLLVNGSLGLTTGFSQKILSRNPIELIKWIKDKLNNKKFNGKLFPTFNGFNGKINQTGDNSFDIIGNYNKIQGNKIEIVEIPVGYTLASYLKVLDKLVEDKKIKDYEDLSDGNNFHINVIFWRNQGLDIDKCNIIQELKLVKSITENYTSLDENNKIAEYKSVEEILEAFYKVRLEFYQKRKLSQINKIKNQLILNASKLNFIKGIIDGTIIISNKSEEFIIKQLETNNNIKKINNNYNYLLNLTCSQLTKEKYNKLKEQVKNDKEQLKSINQIDIKDMWINDLDNLLKELKIK